jgi:nitrate reductase beta subunit
MLFYVPPLSPVIARRTDSGALDNATVDPDRDEALARLPLKYMASLFGAGNETPVSYALRKQSAVRAYRRAVTVGDISMDDAGARLRAADCSVEEAEAIYRLTSLCTVGDRFVIPSSMREHAAEARP